MNISDSFPVFIQNCTSKPTHITYGNISSIHTLSFSTQEYEINEFMTLSDRNMFIGGMEREHHTLAKLIKIL